MRVFSVIGIVLFSVMSYGVDYVKEREAALQGMPWYDAKYIPTEAELEYSEGPPSHIKIRLPLDLKRIIDEYKLQGKPVSLAEACGDRELPFRAEFAARHNDPSRPTYSDMAAELATRSIDSNLINENYVSLDLFLGIGKDGRTDEYRGAGHFVMDTQNPAHWEQLFKFFADQGISDIKQIIFTAMIGPKEIFTDEKFQAILNMLKKGTKLVFPTFGYLSEYNASNYGSKEIEFQNFHYGIVLRGLGVKMFLEEMPKVPELGPWVSTNYGKFFALARSVAAGVDIKAELKKLVEVEFKDQRARTKTMLLTFWPMFYRTWIWQK